MPIFKSISVLGLAVSSVLLDFGCVQPSIVCWCCFLKCLLSPFIFLYLYALAQSVEGTTAAGVVYFPTDSVFYNWSRYRLGLGNRDGYGSLFLTPRAVAEGIFSQICHLGFFPSSLLICHTNLCGLSPAGFIWKNSFRALTASSIVGVATTNRCRCSLNISPIYRGMSPRSYDFDNLRQIGICNSDYSSDLRNMFLQGGGGTFAQRVTLKKTLWKGASKFYM